MSRSQINKGFIIGFIKKINLAFFILSGMLLLSMMIISVTDVLSRFLFNKPFAGTFELTELMMMLSVFLGIAFITLKEQHIEVDIFVPRLHKRIQAFIAMFNSFCGAALFAAMTWQISLRAIQLFQENSETMILRIKDSPFIFIVAICCFVTVLSFSLLIIQSLQQARGL